MTDKDHDIVESLSQNPEEGFRILMRRYQGARQMCLCPLKCRCRADAQTHTKDIIMTIISFPRAVFKVLFVFIFVQFFLKQ